MVRWQTKDVIYDDNQRRTTDYWRLTAEDERLTAILQMRTMTDSFFNNWNCWQWLFDWKQQREDWWTVTVMEAIHMTSRSGSGLGHITRYLFLGQMHERYIYRDIESSSISATFSVIFLSHCYTRYTYSRTSMKQSQWNLENLSVVSGSPFKEIR